MRFIYYDHGYQLGEYLDYLRVTGSTFPTGAREFALASWHFDMNHHQCPHDSWLEYLHVNEMPFGERNQIRFVEISTKYYGAYHDGYFTLIYRGVRRYDIGCSSVKRGSSDIGHGDWIIDEVTIDDDNLVHHEIEFSEGATIRVVCADVDYLWIPKTPDPPKAAP